MPTTEHEKHDYLALIQGRKLLPLSTTGGLSALCFAIINGQTAIIEEYFQNRVAKKAIYFQSDVVKATQQTIPHLLFQFAPLVHPKVLLKRKGFNKCRLQKKDFFWGKNLANQ
jgi:hypothetical protein